MELEWMGYELDHLDLLDPARGELYANATHRDCEHYYGNRTCGNDSYVIYQILESAKESNPDADFSGSGIRIQPDPNASATRCPGFMPRYEYQQELRRGWEDDEKTRREDMNRLAQMGR